ncbi:hypothetical protein ACQP0C_15035 [Nocardia sp. CA-129566]|uniref:hypothetical protein n=1 Tax=Nocardia sp. CA-129566 TaxID=3239976 RepID=UPI003D96294E
MTWIPLRMVVRSKIDAQVMAPCMALDPVIADAVATLTGHDARETFELAMMEGTFEQFLNYGVIDQFQSNSPIRTVSVRELIKHYANREGGVHYGTGEKIVSEFIEQIRDFADEDMRRTILACGRIIVRALEPMAAALMLKDTPWPAGL